MKIRIFKLAKELGLDHKKLVEICGEVGVSVKPSPLASITPEQKDLVVAHLESDSTPSPPTTESSSSLAPTRETEMPASGRIRSMRTVTAKPTPVDRPAADDGSASDAEVEVAAGEEPAAVAETVESSQTDAGEAIETSSPENAGSDVAGGHIAPQRSKPASGIRQLGSRRPAETKARPNRRPRPKTALPNVALPPAYKPPKVDKESDEAPVETQKPDIRLTVEAMQQQSPLAAHLKKTTEQKKGGDEADSLKSRRKLGGIGLEESRQQRRERRRKTRPGDDDDGRGRRGRGMRRRRSRSGPVDLKTSATVEMPITIRSLSEAMGRPARALMQVLFAEGKMVSINDVIDEETAEEISVELGVELEIKRPRDLEAELVASLEVDEVEDALRPRPPIVTVLGHVDHGKTTLLDAIRSANVVDGEAGGITQHIAAYQVERNDQSITFVDTPGHAAFGEMRARGADVTDIVILVVAADDGVMPQTIECIAHAKAADVPIIVAMNKIDLPETNPEKVLADLSANEIMPAEWGGDVEVVRTSALAGEGIDELLETVLLTAELHELQVNPDARATGLCLEAFRDEGRGPLAWLIVQTGTLRKGDVLVCGPAFGKVRAIYNDRDELIDEAGPSTPVRIAGLDRVPGAGDHFHVMDGLEGAREVAELRRERGRAESLVQAGRPQTMEEILEAARAGEAQDLALILKADTPGSIEALRGELAKFEHPEVRVQVLHHGVGGVNESDVTLAAASGAIIIAFHVVPEERARVLAEAEGIEVRRYDVIYEVVDHIKQALEGMLSPDEVEVPTGRAVVLQTFHISRYGTIAGSRVLSGNIGRNDRVRLIRNQMVLNDYAVASLRNEKDDVREVRRGMECGIRLEGFNDIKEGDELQAFRIEQVKRTLD
ncbi:MAG: translation initiation factor IF-2 [Planctomycetaceae bacterium]